VNTASRLTGLLLAGLFLALHLPFLPPSLEDLDSINFALGVRDYDVARHQPHPPGYPLFIAAAKGLHRAGLNEVHALSLLGVVAGALAILALYPIFRELDRDRPVSALTWMAVVLVVTAPLYWVTSARPLSDVTGLAAALAVQAMMLSAAGVRPLAVAAFCAALAVGIRSQVVWLTLPLLALSVWRLPRVVRGRGAIETAVAYLAGALVWLVPLMIVSGGPQAYWRAFSSQGAEDLSGVAMLATTPTLRQLVKALQYAFVWPWGYWQAGAVVLLLAAAGGLHVLWRSRGGGPEQSRTALATLTAAFAPYLVFDLLFQETITTRYALPLVVPVAYLAVRGASLLPRWPAFALVGLIAGASAVMDDATMNGIGRMDAPIFRLIGDMHDTAANGGGATRPVLAMHRREEFDLRRPIQWAGDRMPPFSRRLPSPPKHEWLELVKYWNGGGRDPIWFIGDPLRSDLALVHGDRRPSLYRWPFDLKMLVGGARPNELDWYVVDAPAWYLGEGWHLTPETAGIAREDRKGPGLGGITGWIRRGVSATTLMVGGRNLAPGSVPTRVHIRVDGVVVDEVSVPPGFFLRMLTVPATAGGDYATVAIDADSPELEIEQFDAEPAGRLVFGFADGWHEQEYNPATGVLWRWASDRATIRVRAEGHAAALTLRGEIEAASSSHVTIRVGEAVAAQFDVGRSFARTVVIPASLLGAPESTITIESSASYVPAETRWRSRDARRLGLKMLECRVTAAS
jgi:hypothetical protein